MSSEPELPLDPEVPEMSSDPDVLDSDVSDPDSEIRSSMRASSEPDPPDPLWSSVAEWRVSSRADSRSLEPEWPRPDRLEPRCAGTARADPRCDDGCVGCAAAAGAAVAAGAASGADDGAGASLAFSRVALWLAPIGSGALTAPTASVPA